MKITFDPQCSEEILTALSYSVNLEGWILDSQGKLAKDTLGETIKVQDLGIIEKKDGELVLTKKDWNSLSQWSSSN